MAAAIVTHVEVRSASPEPLAVDRATNTHARAGSRTVHGKDSPAGRRHATGQKPSESGARTPSLRTIGEPCAAGLPGWTQRHAAGDL